MDYLMSTCLNCNSITNNPKFCSLSCSTSFRNKNLNSKQYNKIKYNKNPKLCVKCNSIIAYEKRENRFCSKSCAALYNNKNRNVKKWKHTSDGLNRIRLSAKNNPHRFNLSKINELRRKYKNCPYCNSSFYGKTKYCSNECFKPHHGGFRSKTQLKKHTGIFCGYYMDSGAETYFAKELNKLGIKWIKNDKQWKKYFIYYDHNNKRRKYYPDFYLPQHNIWIEIKGKRYQSILDSYKLNSIPNGKIQMIMSNKIEEYTKSLKWSG